MRIGVSRSPCGSAASTVIPNVPGNTRSCTAGSSAATAPGRRSLTDQEDGLALADQQMPPLSVPTLPVSRANSASLTLRIGKSAKRPRSDCGSPETSSVRASWIRSCSTAPCCQASINRVLGARR